MLIVALILAAVISISLVSYIKLCTGSLKLANRSFYANAASNLAETGLEEGVWSFTQMGSGSAAATVWSTANGWTTDTTKVAAAMLTSGGTGYVTAPSVAFSGGGGSGATATALLSAGIVTGIKITNGGTGYTGAPTVAFTGGSGSGAAATATNTRATRTLATFALDNNATGTVKIFAAGYDGNCATPLVVAKASITFPDGSAPLEKIIEVTLKFNGPFTNGVVAKNGITWNGQPTADSWVSNPTASATGPWTVYSTGTARQKTTVADLTGSVGLGAQGVVNGDLALGAAVTYGGSGSVTGTTSHNFSYDFSMPVYPAAAQLDHYTNLAGSVPATLPEGLDQPNTADGRYYYFATSANISTTILAGRNIVIVGSGNTRAAGTVTLPATSTLTLYIDGAINGTWVNNAWCGALQIFTTTSADTTLNGNDLIKACIYAPNSAITGNGGGTSGAFYGSFIGANVTSNGHMDFHYDESLAKIPSSKPWRLTVWRELQSAIERDLYAQQLN